MTAIAPPRTGPLTAGGSPTIYISDMDRAVQFYTDTLGLKIAYRAGNHFCMIDAGGGLMIGLHPAGPRSPRPGAKGSISVGLNVARPIEQVVAELRERGVKFDTSRSASGINDDGAVKLADFADPDGNALYLCEVKR